VLTAFVLWSSYNGHVLEVYFSRGISPSKIGHIAPFLATIQALSKTRVFLLRVKISEGCFVPDAPPATAISRPYLIIETNSWKTRGYRENRCKVLPARVLFSLNTLTIWYSIRMTVTPSHGLLVTPDCSGETALGSSLHPTKGKFI
jgi:hypothetical protein